MNTPLRPTLWRTCRAIAHETRLRLLWEIFDNDSLCVSALARRINTTEHNASTQLRMLNSRGLIRPYRRKLQVFYKAEANPDVEHAKEILNALRQCRKKKVPCQAIIRQATAFTHQRRIEIVQALHSSALAPGELLKTTGMTSSALSRHFDKLEARGFVTKTGGKYTLTSPEDSFGKVLLQIAAS